MWRLSTFVSECSDEETFHLNGRGYVGDVKDCKSLPIGPPIVILAVNHCEGVTDNLELECREGFGIPTSCWRVIRPALHARQLCARDRDLAPSQGGRAATAQASRISCIS